MVKAAQRKAAKAAAPKADEPLRPGKGNGGGKGGGGGGDGGSGGGSYSRATLGCDVPAPPTAAEYYPDQLTLYGIKLNADRKNAEIPFGDKRLRLEVYSQGDHSNPLPSDTISIAVVYGYAFEGHCYRLDRPRMFIIDDAGMEARGCGFSGPDYLRWNIRSRDSLMELSMSYDLAEVLILAANLPGNKSPNTYGNHMQLAHRNGKLNRPGGP